MVRRLITRPRSLHRLALSASIVTALAMPFSAAPASADNTVPSDADTSVEPDPLTWADLVVAATDEAVEIDGGVLLVTEPAILGPFPSEPQLAEVDEPPTAGASPTVGEAFSLHSNPEATDKVFLDFDGYEMTGKRWNVGRDSTITMGPYRRNRSNDGSGPFTQSEVDGIIDIWERVAEDFAAWNVDITTEDPAPDTPTTSDAAYGTHVVITPDHGWLEGSDRSGGVAYVGVWQNSFFSPAFAFSDNLASGSPKFVAEAASHEIGHTLGLDHDGRETVGGAPATEYYRGHGDWAPIMGVGYDATVTQWSKGEYTGATNVEDDLSVIDDNLTRHGSPNAGTIGGVDSTSIDAISTSGGTSTRSLVVEATPTEVTVRKSDPNGNLLASVTVTDAGDAIVAEFTPTDDDDWSVTFGDLGIGTYTITVRSIGWLTADTGFTDYASIGAYAIDVDAPESSSPTTTSTTTTSTTPPTTSTTPPIITVAGSTIPATTVRPPATSTTTTTTASTPSTTVAADPATTTTTSPTSPSVAPPTTVAPLSPPSPPTSSPPPPTQVASPTTTVPPPTPSAPIGEFLTAISPARLLDTRTDAVITRLVAGANVRLPVAGAGNVPTDASAAVLNVVAVAPSDNGFLSLTPCNDVAADHHTSSLNFAIGSTVANSTVARLSDDGAVCVYSSVAVDVVVDATGWIGPGGTIGLTSTDVRRLADTRSPNSPEARLRAGRPAVFDLRSAVGDGTEAISVNITAVAPSANGYLTVDDCSGGGGTASLNFAGGEARGNNGIFALSSGRSLCVTSSVDTDVIIDLTGEFGPDGRSFVAADPQRLLDTRTDRALNARTSIGFAVPPVADAVPLGVVAASVNIAAVGHATNGYVTSWNCGPLPETSALNPISGEVTANGAVIQVNDVGRSCLHHSVGGHIVVDLNGWWV